MIKHNKPKILSFLISISILSLILTFFMANHKIKNNINDNKITVPETSFELVKQMRLGWNLGNSLDAMHKDKGFTLDTELFWGNPKTTQEIIKAIKVAGFKSIRIPVSYYNHIDENGVIDAEWLNRIEEVVGWALENNLYTIINIHHDTGMNPSLNWIYADVEAYEQSKKDFINLWKQIAVKFVNYNNMLIFQSSGEWMNKDLNWNIDESMEDFKIVHELNQTFIDTVRTTGGNNTDRYLMLSPFSASAEEEIIRAMFYKPFTDVSPDKLILSVHSYIADIETIKKGALILNKISKDYNIPVVLDEFGLSNFMNNDIKKEILKTYVREATKYNIACFFWDDGYEYVVINRKTGKPEDYKFLEEILLIVNTGN